MMLWQDTAAVLLWCTALAYVVHHVIATYTNTTSCNSCSHKSPTRQQSNKPVQLGASLQRGLQLARQHAK